MDRCGQPCKRICVNTFKYSGPTTHKSVFTDCSFPWPCMLRKIVSTSLSQSNVLISHMRELEPNFMALEFTRQAEGAEFTARMDHPTWTTSLHTSLLLPVIDRTLQRRRRVPLVGLRSADIQSHSEDCTGHVRTRHLWQHWDTPCRTQWLGQNTWDTC